MKRCKICKNKCRCGDCVSNHNGHTRSHIVRTNRHVQLETEQVIKMITLCFVTMFEKTSVSQFSVRGRRSGRGLVLAHILWISRLIQHLKSVNHKNKMKNAAFPPDASVGLHEFKWAQGQSLHIQADNVLKDDLNRGIYCLLIQTLSSGFYCWFLMDNN